MKDSKIEWTHHTFNPWWGCEKVSPACKHCYAEAFAKRVGQDVWGATAPRRTFGAKHWLAPIGWDRVAMREGRRERVFCASMADVFEDHPVAAQERPKLWPLIAETPNLDWLLLTKRPENANDMVPTSWVTGAWPDNVWLGATVEDQERADLRIPALLATGARVKFLSCEPLLGPLDLSAPFWWAGLDWVIVGGESGAPKKVREFRIEWARSLVKQCRGAGVPVFVKQLGARVGEEAEGEQGAGVFYLRLKDAKGGDWNEWPEDLRVREYPKEKGKDDAL